MAIRSSTEILEAIKEHFSEDNSDETLAFIEDISDTIHSYEQASADVTNWKQKYEDNDKEWREKYKARFFNPEKVEDTKPETYDEDEPAVLTYDKLFKEG